MILAYIGKDAMVVETRGCENLVAQTINSEISTNATFYVAHIDGEDRKYGLSRTFVTEKQSPYSLRPGQLMEGEVYEIKADDTGERFYFEWGGMDGDTPNVTVIDEGDNVDNDAILEVVESDTDAKSTQVRQRAHNLIDDTTDTDALEVLVDMLESADSSRDPGELATVDLANVPDDVRKATMLRQRTFAAAFEKQTGQAPGAHLLAAVRDGAVLAERKERQNGGAQ
jgi:hypothetical protein